MSLDPKVEMLARFEVDMIKRIWQCMDEEEETFEAICRRLTDEYDETALQKFMCRASTGWLLAVAFHRFKTATMNMYVPQHELSQAFMAMVHDKTKNVIDHWREDPE
jgi:hypothetical protein